ncbi:MAG: lytic murein transglycosylase, partial [Desulfobacterales bacterium]|nr:lytic murein transglycosylase [Desulfobacterales bacterium]
MNTKMHPYSQKLIICLICFLFLIPIISVSAQEVKKGSEFDDLIQRLVQDGFDPEKTKELFSRESVFFNPEGVSLFFVHSESSLNYDQFSSKKSIQNAQKYLETHKETLDRAEKEYGVDKTVITAILLVETRLGSYLGKRTVINTLSTMAALTDESLRQRIWDVIPEKRKPKKETFLKKVNRRSKWGYEELKA